MGTNKSHCFLNVLILVFNSGIDFDGDTVGLANKFAMCTGSSGGINQVIQFQLHCKRSIVKGNILW